LVTERPTVCNQIHLPFQAGANRILEMMNRRHTIEEYLEKVRYLRSINPSVEMSTDLIVGFPSETEEEFEWTLRVLEEVRFGLVYSFKYSPRPGTRAAKRFEDDVPREVKEERLQRVIALQEEIDQELKEGYFGTEQEVLIDGAHPRERGAMNGRTDGYRPVTVRDWRLEIGDIAPVRITGWRNNWLEGEALAAAGCPSVGAS
jgi:tRNA-2-methylthio-N6-dimethylallyladenosine synthase